MILLAANELLGKTCKSGKITMKRFLSIIVIVVSLLYVGNLLAEETKIKFSIGEWEPYTGEKIENFGMATEIVTAAIKTVGLQGEYSFFPWKRAEYNVLRGTSFGTFPYKEIQARSTDYMFSNKLFSSSFGILTHKKNVKPSDLNLENVADLKGYRVGIVTGTDAIRIPLSEIGVAVEEAPTGVQNLKKLEVGRIDFYIDDKAVIFQAMKKNYNVGTIADFHFLKNDFGEKNDFKIMISKKHPESQALLDKINDGLTRIAESGELKSILAKYGL